MKCDWQMNCLEKEFSKRSKERNCSNFLYGHLFGTHGGNGERGEIALAKTQNMVHLGNPKSALADKACNW